MRRAMLIDRLVEANNQFLAISNYHLYFCGGSNGSENFKIAIGGGLTLAGRYG
jgi:hypothetical protein